MCVHLIVGFLLQVWISESVPELWRSWYDATFWMRYVRVRTSLLSFQAPWIAWGKPITHKHSHSWASTHRTYHFWFYLRRGPLRWEAAAKNRRNNLSTKWQNYFISFQASDEYTDATTQEWQTSCDIIFCNWQLKWASTTVMFYYIVLCVLKHVVYRLWRKKNIVRNTFNERHCCCTHYEEISQKSQICSIK